MPHNKDVFKYVVLGDGIVETEAIAKSLMMTGTAKFPIPEFHYVTDMKKANAIAEKMKPHHSTILICSVKKVFK